MPCLSPLRGYSTSDGPVTFSSRHPAIIDSLTLPCGKCRFCVLDLSRQWMVRAVHEGLSHVHSCFVTLTYADEHLPAFGSLSRRDPQLFLKRLRWWCQSVGIASPSVFGCGEYGSVGLRPHYHLCIFGLWFPDAVARGKSETGGQLFESEILSGLWGLGRCNFSAFTPATAGYVARYSAAKFEENQMQIYDPVTDPETGELVLRQLPFLIAPKRPALGLSFIEKHHEGVYSHDSIVLPDGHTSGRVKFYDEWLREHVPERFEAIKADRLRSAREGADPDEVMRLLARSHILEQRVSRLSRGGV